MLRTFLIGKIHRATVTGANPDYIGSITIDPVLMQAAGFAIHEQIHVVNVTNSHRFVTYAIAGTPDSGVVILNGGAAHLAQLGDKVILIAYGLFTTTELNEHQPKVVFVDQYNRQIVPSELIPTDQLDQVPFIEQLFF